MSDVMELCSRARHDAVRRHTTHSGRVRAIDDAVDVEKKRAGRMSKMVPVVRLELTTYRLQGGCSTN